VPAKRGICAFEDETGATLALVAGADLRRAVRRRLSPPEDDAGPSRRAELRGHVRTVRGLTVGSTFESDWVHLALAAERLPLVHAMLVDRYRPWFVHVDAEAPIPQLTRSATPTGGPGTWLGPMADKSAAGRFIELLQDAFDLCRYHDLLVQAPHAQACAYKEMGRCPAPCDGTVSLESYRRQVRDAVAFVAANETAVADELREAMATASERMEYETARRCKERIDRLEATRRDRFAIVDHIDRFRFLAIQAAEPPGLARIFLIAGGTVEPLADLTADITDRDRLRSAAGLVLASANERSRGAMRLDAPAVAVIGLVCNHLFAPRRRTLSGRFLKLDERLDPLKIVAAIEAMHRDSREDEQDAACGVRRPEPGDA
jgi:excinuclease UvrABC nuclease subunit